MKSEEDIKAAIEQATGSAKRADTIQEVKYWYGFADALEWLNSEDKKQDGFKDE